MAEAQTTDLNEDAWDNATNNKDYAYKTAKIVLGFIGEYPEGEFFNSGHLDEAILTFEAEVQQHPNNSEAWRTLGATHIMTGTITNSTLARAVEKDPYNLSALLALGVVNANELKPQDVLKTLKAWVKHNPKFQMLAIQVDEYSDGSLMDEVVQQARAHDPNDSGVQV